MMKVTLTLLSLFLLSAGCFSSQKTAEETDIQVVTAIYTEWSDPPPSGSDIPERGIDLMIVVQNRPADYTPHYIVFHNRRSSSANLIAGGSPGRADTITARIIQMSGLIQERSGFVNTTDRLVFTTPDGESSYIEIDSWQRADD